MKLKKISIIILLAVFVLSEPTFNINIAADLQNNKINKNNKSNKSSSAKGSLVKKQIVNGKEKRTYYEYIPTSYKADKAIPLVIMLHGADGTPKQIDDMTGWSNLAQHNNFIVVYPYKKGWWNAYNWKKNDDDSFLTNVIKNVETDYKINNKKIFLCGYSIGGSMAVTYTFRHAEKLAAVALVSPAWMASDNMFNLNPYKLSQPKKQLPVYVWRGQREGWPDSDETQLMIKYWSYLNKDKNKPSIVKSGKYTTYTYAGGKGNVLYTEIANGTHVSYTPDDFKKIWYDFFAHY